MTPLAIDWKSFLNIFLPKPVFFSSKVQPNIVQEWMKKFFPEEEVHKVVSYDEDDQSRVIQREIKAPPMDADELEKVSAASTAFPLPPPCPLDPPVCPLFVSTRGVHSPRAIIPVN